MQKLTSTLAQMEEALIALERRGISLKLHAERKDADGRLPIFHVVLGHKERWFVSRSALDAFLEEEEAATSVAPAGNVVAGSSHSSASRTASRTALRCASVRDEVVPARRCFAMFAARS